MCTEVGTLLKNGVINFYFCSFSRSQKIEIYFWVELFTVIGCVIAIANLFENHVTLIEIGFVIFDLRHFGCEIDFGRV